MFKGGCLCKAINYEVTGGIKFSVLCFCRECQNISGGGHLPQMAVDRDTVTMIGPLKIRTWKSESGNDIEHAFCSECGSSIYKSTSMMPENIFLVAGSLDDPSIFKADQRVYEDSRQPWDRG